MSYTINQFWKERFSNITENHSFTARPGWRAAIEQMEAFEEAGLSLRPDLDNLEQPVWLIAAPGAVGKSTLAQQLCAATGAIYLDLAVADTVGGNYITGGLVHTNTLNAWQSGQTTLVIDALDEARLRVTQQAFEDFLQDIWRMAQNRSLPVVLLGRVGIMEEAWTIFAEKQNVELPIFNIEHFTTEQARSFVSKRLRSMANSSHSIAEYSHLANLLNQHPQVYESLTSRLIADLQDLARTALEEFIGYAPVLEAVVKLIAVQSNPSQFQGLRDSAGSQVLRDIAAQILERESKKLTEQLEARGHHLVGNEYPPQEQLERLACRLFHLPPPPVPSSVPVPDQPAYIEAVNSLLEQHPFLDGSGREPSNPVFAACINAAALQHQTSSLCQSAEQYCLQQQHTPNPFLYDFYTPDSQSIVPTGHIGLLYESVLAKSKAGDSIGLSIDEDESGLLAVEITGVTCEDYTPQKYQFTSNTSDLLTLGRRIGNLAIDAPNLFVSLGSNDVLEMLAPVTVQCQALEFQCNRMIVKESKYADFNSAVVLEAQEATATHLRTSPLVSQDAQLLVSWPGAEAFPWTDYSEKQVRNEDYDLADLLRTFRRLVMAFRSHSKGRLARLKDKVDHARMLKDDRGRALLEKMKAERIISSEKHMYFLDPEALGMKAGASFQDVNLKRYTDQTMAYLRDL